MAATTRIKTLYLILTARCNLSCGYCFQNDKARRSMDWETVRASIDLALASHQGCVELVFFGGEPLLEFPLIRRAIAYARRKRPPALQVKFGIITNGTLLTPAVAAFLARHAFDTQLSFDGVPAAQEVRGRGTFARLDRLLGQLAERQAEFFEHHLKVSLTFTPQTMAYLAESFDYFLSKDVREIVLSPVFTHAMGWALEKRRELDAQFSQIFSSSVDYYGRTGRIPLQLFRSVAPPPGEKVSPAMCGVMRGETPAVDVDGQVHGCATFAESFQKFPSKFLSARIEDMRMGHLADPAFETNYERFPEAVRRAGLFHDKRNKHSSYGRCGECPHLASCSVCPVSIGHIPGNEDPDRVPDFPCAFNLVSLKYRDLFVRRIDLESHRSRRDYLSSRMRLLKRIAATVDGSTGTESATPPPRIGLKNWRAR